MVERAALEALRQRGVASEARGAGGVRQRATASTPVS